MLVATGLKLTDDLLSEVTRVVEEAYDKGLPIQSDWARRYGDSVAAAACLGLITTLTLEGNFGRRWRPTARGLHLMEYGCLP